MTKHLLNVIKCSISEFECSSHPRYKAIVKPMDIQRSTAKICFRAAAIWLFSMILAVPEVVFSDLHTFNIGQTNDTFVTCAPYPHAGELHPKIHSMAFFLIFYIIPLLIISVYYCFIARSLIQSASDMPVEAHLHIKKQVCECVSGHWTFRCLSFNETWEIVKWENKKCVYAFVCVSF